MPKLVADADERCGCVDKNPRINSEAGGERPDLTDVEMAPSGQHFGDDALAPYLGQIFFGTWS